MLFSLLFALSTECLAGDASGKVVSISGRVLSRNDRDKTPHMTFMKTGDIIAPGSIINTDSTSSVKLLMSDKTILDLGPSTLFKISEYKLNGGSDREVGLQMDYGKIRASVNTPVGAKGKFTVKTRTASMGVRGTEFSVVADSSAPPPPASSNKPGNGSGPGSGKSPGGGTVNAPTAITVFHGTVAVQQVTASGSPLKGAKAPAAIPVTAGQQLTTHAVAPLSQGGVQLASANFSAAPTVVTLSPTQLSTARSESVVADNTFKASITIESSNSNGNSSSSSGGNSSGNKENGGSNGGGGGGNSGNTRALAEAAAIISTAPAIEIPTNIPTAGVPNANIPVAVAPPPFVPKSTAIVSISFH